MRSSSPSVRPRARWSGCFGDELRDQSSLPGRGGRESPARGVPRVPDRSTPRGSRPTVPPHVLLLLLLVGHLGRVVHAHPDRRARPRAVELVVLGRPVGGALTLLPLVVGRAASSPRSVGRLVPLVVLGALNTRFRSGCSPLAETQHRLGLSAVIQAAAPIFTVLLAVRIDAEPAGDRVAARRLLRRLPRRRAPRRAGRRGGDAARRARRRRRPRSATRPRRLYAGRTVRSCRRSRSSLGTCSAPSVADRPVGLAQLPAERLARERSLAVVALGVVGTGTRLPPLLRAHRGAGASRAILVTYLVPALALVYGADLPRRAGDCDGGRRPRARPRGVALATGLVRRRRAACVVASR